MEADFYELLGVSRQATAAQIKQAYRTAAMRYHPDKCPGDRVAEERFKQAARAYAVLSDPLRRRRYDMLGSASSNPADFDPRRMAEHLSQVFGELFGGLLGQRPAAATSPMAARDTTLQVPFAVAATGGTLTLQLERLEACHACAGSGGHQERAPLPCADCGGSGAWRYKQGIFSLKKACAACRGSGRVRPEPCPACGGQGSVTVRRSLTVEVPPGVDTGSRLDLPHEGDFDPQQRRMGPLRLHCQVDAPAQFDRHGAELRQRLVLSPCEAALGCSRALPSLTGSGQVKVPPGTQSGTQLRLRGQGLPHWPTTGGRGDMLVEIVVEVPGNLSAEQQALWRSLAELDGPQNYRLRRL